MNIETGPKLAGNYFVFVPCHPKLYAGLWEFLSSTKFQIHHSRFHQPDLLEEKKYLVLDMTTYFLITKLMDYLVTRLTPIELHKYGSPNYELKPKPKKRRYVRKQTNFVHWRKKRELAKAV